MGIESYHWNTWHPSDKAAYDGLATIICFCIQFQHHSKMFGLYFILIANLIKSVIAGIIKKSIVLGKCYTE